MASATRTREVTTAMRTILVPVEQHDLIDSVLQTAWLLAQQFDCYVEGFAARSAFAGLAVGDIGVPTITEVENAEAILQARRMFEDHMLGRGLSRGDSAAGPAFGWRDDAPVGDAFIGSYGRVFDVVVVGRPDTGANSPRMSTAEAALFESGRPILVAPPAPPKRLGDTVVIAWNGSTETASTVALAMPLLERARRVVVLGVKGWGEPPAAERLTDSLRRNGIAAETSIAPAEGGTVGEVILAKAASFDCDLLVKGAYTQSRLRQMIFGGATSHVLSRATLPVFLAH
jgi:nucleotide-binding universal stress UspA family protein